MCESTDERFARHIREYYREMLNEQFITSPRGFISFSTDGTDLIINELYVEPNSNILESYRLIKRAIEIGKQRGCNRLIGGNETANSAYLDIKKLHTWFGMTYLNSNGTMDYWSKPI